MSGIPPWRNQNINEPILPYSSHVHLVRFGPAVARLRRIIGSPFIPLAFCAADHRCIPSQRGASALAIESSRRKATSWEAAGCRTPLCARRCHNHRKHPTHRFVDRNRPRIRRNRIDGFLRAEVVEHCSLFSRGRGRHGRRHFRFGHFGEKVIDSSFGFDPCVRQHHY